MKNDMIMDILIIAAVVLVMAGAAAIWGLWNLGAGIPVLCLAGGATIIGEGIIGGKMYELAESEEEETNNEERL